MEMTLKVKGMSCKKCEAHLKAALEALDGVTLATPNKDEMKVDLVLSKEVPFSLLEKTVYDEGFDVIK